MLKTPYFVLDEDLLIKNLKILKYVEEQTGCHVLLAQKCFSMYSTYPLIGKYLSGTTASGLNEAKLGRKYMGDREVHVYSAAYRDDEIDQILNICDHIVFNSFSQWKRFKDKAKASGKECGIRINPECSTQHGNSMYDPCAPFSRMGVTIDNFEQDLEGISGLHFHTLCEQNSDDLVKTLRVVEEKFGHILYDMKWLNFGGGHHITMDDYNIDILIECVKHMRDKYNLEIYIEPGEAVALNAGFLESSVLDIVKNGINIAILDISAACHMPDVLEVPYTPEVVGAKIADENILTNKDQLLYRLAGPTCLSGDVIGDYIFDKPLKTGDRVIFCDMAIYTMVKTNTFNGMNLPSIIYKSKNEYKLIKEFGYEDFEARL